MFLDWLQRLKELGDKPEKELGKGIGRQASNRFRRHAEGSGTFTMWIDNATGEPVRIEYDLQVNGAAGTYHDEGFSLPPGSGRVLVQL